VPNGPSTQLGWSTLGVSGPMARNVRIALCYSAYSPVFDQRSPISIEQPGSQFFAAARRAKLQGRPRRNDQDLGLPWEPAVMAAFRAQRKIFESLGCIVEVAEPDLRDANECFLAWRHWAFELQLGETVDAHPDQVNAYGHWHVRKAAS